jgi:hypothetical protein
MSGVFQNIDLPPAPASVYPPRLWCGGRTHSLGGEEGWGTIFWKTLDICKYFVATPLDSCAFFLTTFGRKAPRGAGFELPVCLAGSWKMNTGRKGLDRAGTG